MKTKINFILLAISILISASYCFDIKDLTIEQKIGQLFMVAAVADENLAHDCIHHKSYRMDKDYIEHLITQYHIGGIVYLGKSDYHKQIERTQHFQNISEIPLIIGQDLEPGRVGAARLPDVCNYPSNQSLGENNDLEKTYQTSFAIGNLCKTLGVHINFAPVADVNSNPDNPIINDRAFSNDPGLVACHAYAFVTGLHDAGIIACAKHFPGHGDTRVDSHLSLPRINHTKERLEAIELYPFKKLIAQNIPAIMVGHLSVSAYEATPDTPATMSYSIVTELLRNKLGFQGLIITDALDMAAVTLHYENGSPELHALLAGNDILLCPVDVPAAVSAIKKALADRLISEQEIDAHIERILLIKNNLS